MTAGTDAMGGRVFCVDDHEDTVRTTTKLLTRERPNLTVEGFTDPEKALQALKQEPPDILLTDQRMAGMNGLELMVAARTVVPGLPVIVATAYSSPDFAAQLQNRSLVECLEKPLQPRSLIASIDRLLTRGGGFSGAISLPMLPDLIQLYTLSQTTGALSIQRRGQTGTIWFDEGKIVHARCGEQADETAFYQLLAWQGGEFAFENQARPPERTITTGWQELLLEGTRQLDETRRNSTPAEPEEKDATQAPAPATSERQPRRREARTTSSSATKAGNGEQRYSLQETLNGLAKIKGAVGAAIFDGATHLVFAHQPKGPIDLETAVAGNARVLAALYSTLRDLQIEDPIADVLMTLPEQYHLIRPMSQRRGTFIYLVLDRKRGDLSLARAELAVAENFLGWLRSADPIPAEPLDLAQAR